jgi:hypothetical protein
LLQLDFNGMFSKREAAAREAVAAAAATGGD